jgi:hypothetical protein
MYDLTDGHATPGLAADVTGLPKRDKGGLFCNRRIAGQGRIVAIE